MFAVFLEKRYDDLVIFAGVHNRKVEHLEKIMNTSSHYKVKRAVNLENARLHAKVAEVKTGRARGDCAKLPKIRQLVGQDAVLQNLSKEGEETLKKGMAMFQELKINGTCPLNKACAIDYHTKVQDLNDQL
jgi:hypothetical protein